MHFMVLCGNMYVCTYIRTTQFAWCVAHYGYECTMAFGHRLICVISILHAEPSAPSCTFTSATPTPVSGGNGECHLIWPQSHSQTLLCMQGLGKLGRFS